MTPRPDADTARRVVMVVNNGVHGDSRVQRVARAAADAGWQVRVVGRAPAGGVRRSVEDGVEVVLVPVRPVLSARGDQRNPALVRGARALLRERDRRLAASSWARRLAPLTAPLTVLRHGAWRLLDPWVQDLELALAPWVEDHRPHLIHAHDRHTVPLAARSAAALRAAGTPTAWVLDAHEYVAATAARGATGLRGRLRRAMVVGEQDEFIRDADAVVTVSETLAGMLRSDHRLAATPTVVLNAPAAVRPADQAGTADAGVPDLRDRLGLDADVPLLVYSGGCAPARGLATVVDALPALPGVHLALVVADDDPDVPALLDRARERGVGDRVHRTGYVPADQVTALLAGADVGLVPLLHRPNHEISLVTKYLEYLHAGLPVVTSDVREMAGFTREHRLGEVFTAGDADGLAAAVRAVLADRGAYAQRVRTSQAVAATAWPHQARRLLAVYDAAVERAARRPPGARIGSRP